ncbi:MAG: type I polyketide synthase, partial [Pseudomonadota bacterium]
MSEKQADQEQTMSSAKQALLEIRRLRTELTRYQQAEKSAIAIVGCGMRFPGQVNSPDSYWDFLLKETSAIREVPSDRWDPDRYYNADRNAPGTMYTKSGGFLDDIDQFDAGFFGISPREADSMDPQQRLLLTTSVEALDDAGIDTAKLKGSRTGVFFALSNFDYGRLVFNDPVSPDVSAATGNNSSVAAGRVSYTLGLQGPSMVVDTACSSSLVALHLAVASLRRGECDTALVGGVNLILSPEMHINFCQAQMLSPDGRCKTFDHSADGYGRGEGCGVIVLKREVDAKANKDRVYACVRGSASNQDGQSAGLTAPNGLAQESVIADALSNAGLTPDEIDYVEAHGTGTPLGDPIEARALGAALGTRRTSSKALLIGSVKTNFGHLEAAAGIAGVIKTALSLYHKKLPRHLNFTEANREISLDELRLQVVSKTVPWPTAGRGNAGISSFGFGGTNAHVILGAADPVEVPQAVEGAQLLVISARTRDALKAQAQRFADYLSTGDQDFGHIARSSVQRRSHYEHRLALVSANAAEAASALLSFAQSRPGLARYNKIVEGAEPPRLSFWYAGQGTQYTGMGKGLYESYDEYRLALDEVTDLFDRQLGSECKLLDLMHGTDDSASVNDALFAQAAIFSTEYALTRLLQSFGVDPELVAGHSLGEYLA